MTRRPPEPPAASASGPALASRLQEALLSSPYTLPAGGALALAVATLTVLGLLRRRRQPASPSAEAAPPAGDPSLDLEDAPALPTVPERPPRPGFAEVLAASREPAEEAPPFEEPTQEVTTAPAQRASDPIAEADVYLAYGRSDEAAALLKAAMQAEPRRADIAFKLLELHAARQDVDAFEAVADEMYTRTGGQGPEWSRVAALQRTLAVQDDLPPFEEASVPAQPSASAAGPARPSDTGPAVSAAAAPVAAAVATAPAVSRAAVAPPRQEPTLGPEPVDLPAADFALDMDIAQSSTRDDIPRDAMDLGDFDRTEPVLPSGSTGDPLERKLALAEEFIQIGDVDGARDLLGEVGSQGDGALRERARRLLDALG